MSATRDEWRIIALPIHGHQIVGSDGREVVRDIYDERYAEQITKEHNAVAFAVECGRNWSLDDWRNWLDFHAHPALSD